MAGKKEQLSTGGNRLFSELYGNDATSCCGLSERWAKCPPQTIWSLLDMMQLCAEFFTRTAVALDKLHHEILTNDDWQHEVEITVLPVQKECQRIGFRQLAAQADRVIHKAKIIFTTPADRRQEVKYLVQELRLAIDSKLQSCLFLSLDRDKIEYFSVEDTARFGEEVEKWIPDSTYQISEACRCFALERWDACVHHLMLASEIAIRKWGARFKRVKKAPIGLVDWKPILDAANCELDRLRNLKKTVRTEKQKALLAEQISHFGCIKDAYRNHSAHGREHYDGRRAGNIMRHVEAFLQSLAKAKGV